MVVNFLYCWEVKLTLSVEIITYIPGIGRVIQENFIILVSDKCVKYYRHRIIQGTLDAIGVKNRRKDWSKYETKKNPILTLEKATKNVGSKIIVKTRRVGGSIYQIPIEICKQEQIHKIAVANKNFRYWCNSYQKYY